MRNVACIGSLAGTKKPVLPSSIIDSTRIDIEQYLNVRQQKSAL
jgi:hypothetical protein